MPSWLMSAGPILLHQFAHANKYDPLVAKSIYRKPTQNMLISIAHTQPLPIQPEGVSQIDAISNMNQSITSAAEKHEPY